MDQHYRTLLAAFLCSLWASSAVAQDNVSVTTILDGLKNPCGVAVQPGTGFVFVADSAAGRIIRVTTSGEEEVITGFPKDVYGKGTYEQQTKFDIGPLGLAFIERNTLVVGGGGLADGEELLRVYAVPDTGKSITANDMKFPLGPIPAGGSSSSGEGNFYGVAVDEGAIYVTCNGDDEKGWIARAKLTEGKPSKLTPFIKTKELTGIDAPVGVTMSKEGYLVVGQMGEITEPSDSLLTFYDAISGNILSNFKTGLHDVAGLAYSPGRGLLYAVDFGWGEHANDGGVYRLDAAIEDGKPAVKAVKIVELDKPSAITFAPNGAMYVTVFGSPEDGSEKASGKLVRITGKL